jgi:hypothetical protein
MLVIAETHARLKDERFDRPLRLRDVSDFAGRKCARFLAATRPTKPVAIVELSRIELASPL